MHVINLCEFVKPVHLINLYLCNLTFYMHYNVWRDKKLRGTNLCDLHLTHIIRIDKSHAYM